MPFPSKQNPLDWITQYWNILFGNRVDFDSDSWLLGPIGNIKEDSNQFINRISKENELHIKQNLKGSGLLENLAPWDLSIHPEIEEFYKHTIDYKLNVQTLWKPVFGSLGFLVAALFSRRVQQLNIPNNTVDESVVFENEIINLINEEGTTKFKIWRRSISHTGEIVFYGIYTTCKLPSGELCIKAIFPLPRGSATVIFRLESGSQGNLLLSSSGKKYGDPGFYFLVKDRNGKLWKHYLPGFRETILLSKEDDSSLTAKHTLKLWSVQVYKMIYTITHSIK